MSTRTEVKKVIDAKALALMQHNPVLTKAAAVARAVMEEPRLFAAYQQAVPDEERAQVPVDVRKSEYDAVRTAAEALAKTAGISLIAALQKLGEQRLAKENPQPPPQSSIPEQAIASAVSEAQSRAATSTMSFWEALAEVARERQTQEQSDQGGMAQPTRASKGVVRVAKATSVPARDAWLVRMAQDTEIPLEVLRKCAADVGLLAA